MKVVLRFVGVMSGGLCVTRCGTSLMLVSSADNKDFLPQV